MQGTAATLVLAFSYVDIAYILCLMVNTSCLICAISLLFEDPIILYN